MISTPETKLKSFENVADASVPVANTAQINNI